MEFREGSIKRVRSMYKRLFQGVVLSTAIIFLGAADATAAKKKPMRVKGSMKGTLTLSPTNITSGVYTLRVDAVGSLSHLGRATAVWEGDLSLDANLQPTPLTGLGWTLTSKNGGSLQGTLTWTATAVTNQPLVYSLSGTFQTTGGTGRLRGATGEGSVTGTINAATGKTTLHLDALVNNPRSKKLRL